MTKQVTTQDLWAGTDESYALYADIEAKIEARYGSDDMPTSESLLQVQNGVGVINIKGPISNTDSPWNALFGATSYPAICDALIEAANNQSVKEVLLDIDTPGGSVSGLADTADLIAQINKSVKPVVAYATGGALSAGYWLACSAGKLFAGKTASIGSIGIIMTHAERSTQLKEAGVNVTVLRSGKYKALASAVEPLSVDARAQIQESLDAAYEVFADHVAKSRGMTMPIFEATAGQGRVFFGAKAKDVGLIDGVKNFSEVFNDVSKRASASGAMRAESPQLEGVNPMAINAVLTEQAIAAIAAGATLITPPATTEAAAAAAEIAPAAAEVQSTETIVEPATTEAAAAVEAAAPSALEVLQAQLLTKEAALLDATVATRNLEAQVAQFKEAQGPLLAIVAKSLANMQVALGGTAASVEGRSAADVLAEHSRVSETFSNKFKAGGVSATSAVEALKEAPVAVNSLHKARIAATQPNR